MSNAFEPAVLLRWHCRVTDFNTMDCRRACVVSNFLEILCRELRLLPVSEEKDDVRFQVQRFKNCGLVIRRSIGRLEIHFTNSQMFVEISSFVRRWTSTKWSAAGAAEFQRVPTKKAKEKVKVPVTGVPVPVAQSDQPANR